MLNNALPYKWKQVIYQSNNQQIPNERWGHQFVKTAHQQLVLFGGFGGDSSDGKYLNDVWSFSLKDYTWTQVETKGEIPEIRSNYTIHYNAINNEIIVFGGGSENKARFNTVCILNWKTKIWRKIGPQQSHDAPWERTYHSSQFLFPHLIIYGGQGISNLDLDDMWAFNVQDYKWTRIQFQQSEIQPIRRRFQSSALINNHFYVIGGCTGNYKLLGDIYRVNLSNLIQKNQSKGFKWQCLISKNNLVERWGHTSSVFDNKIYTFAGRSSDTIDNNDIYVFDPKNMVLKVVDVDNNSAPKPRRRHASVMVGNSMLVFGGYNGKYLSDFNYLTLKELEPSILSKTELIQVENLNQFNNKVNMYQQQKQSNVILQIYQNQKKITEIKSTKHILLNHIFFKNMLTYSNGSELRIDLPSACNQFTFKLIHMTLIEKKLFICRKKEIQFYFHLLASIEYFCINQLIPLIEKYLISLTNSSNAISILNGAIELELSSLKMNATQVYLLSSACKNNKDTSFEKEKIRKNQQINFHISEYFFQDNKKQQDSLSFIKQDIFAIVYNRLKFEIEQTKMKQSNSNFLQKAAEKVKKIFSKNSSQQSQSNKSESSRKNSRSKQSQKGCFSKFIGFISGLCNHSRVHQQPIEQISNL